MKKHLPLVFLLLLLGSACKKDSPQPPVANNDPCTLIAKRTTIMGMVTTDSIYYQDGKIIGFKQFSTGSPVLTTDYTFFGQDSLYILKQQQLTNILYFDSQQRIIRVVDIANSSEIFLTYDNNGDSIRMIIDGELAQVMYRNSQGNIVYARTLDNGNVRETYSTYDNKPSVYKGFYHDSQYLFTLSTNNLRSTSEYNNGVLVSTQDLVLTYTASGQLSRQSMMDGLVQQDFFYRCP